MDGSEMLRFMSWAQGVLTLDPAAPTAIKDVALVYKLHIVLGLTLFVITPFTRLVHVWSAPIWFLLRPRSEEHTSELQSLMRISYAAFGLKKTTNTTHKAKQQL